MNSMRLAAAGKDRNELWDVAYRWSYGTLGTRWLQSVADGRLIGFRASVGGEIFVPPAVPLACVGETLMEVPLGPGGEIQAVTFLPGVTSPNGTGRIVARVAVDGAPLALFADINVPASWTRRTAVRNVTIGTRVRFAAHASGVTSARDVRFELARE